MYDAETFAFMKSFDSVREVCEYLDLDYKNMNSSISRVCRREQKTLMRKYIFREANDDEFSTK